MLLQRKQLNLFTHKWVKAKVASQPACTTPQQQQQGVSPLLPWPATSKSLQLIQWPPKSCFDAD
jgi:hypothetical protein